MSDSNIAFPPNSVSNPGFSRFETLITAEKLKSLYLHSVSFVGDDGKDIDPEVFENAIRVGISKVEHEFDITVTPTIFTERHDYNYNDYENYCFLQLYHRPILIEPSSVEHPQGLPEIKAQYIKSQDLIEFPGEWIRTYTHEGQIQMTPTSGAIAQFNIANAGFLPRIFGVKRTYPQLFQVKYKAGFEQDKIPAIVNRLVGCYAAIMLLNIAGDLILGAGISSESISMDGLSQSIQSTASATFSGYGARMEAYRREIKDLSEIVRGYYKAVNFLIA